MRILKSTLCFLLVGLNGLLGQEGKELIVEFSEIDSLQYLRFKKEYPNRLVKDSTKKTIPDSSFTLIINNKSEKFDCEKDYAPCYYYEGFLLPINSFVITHCIMYQCVTYLIDKASGERQYLFGPFENQCEVPVLSKDLNKMLIFSSDVYDKESFISLYKRTSKNEDFDFETHDSLTTDKWKILEAIWIDDTKFALKTFDKYSGDKPLNVNFVKGEIK